MQFAAITFETVLIARRATRRKHCSAVPRCSIVPLATVSGTHFMVHGTSSTVVKQTSRKRKTISEEKAT
jgi:hypothetical protein